MGIMSAWCMHLHYQCIQLWAGLHLLLLLVVLLLVVLLLGAAACASTVQHLCKEPIQQVSV